MKTTKRIKLFYIGERFNPQFKKPYFVAYGILSKTAVKEKESSVYGSMSLTPYETEELYNQKIEQLKDEGYNVHVR